MVNDALLSLNRGDVCAIPDELVPELRENWRTWVIGNALRELDQFLSPPRPQVDPG